MQIALIFEETAAQEKEHAKRFFDFLEGGEVEITDICMRRRKRPWFAPLACIPSPGSNCWRKTFSWSEWIRTPDRLRCIYRSFTHEQAGNCCKSTLCR